MSLISCVYKNCGNYINSKNRKLSDVKLFSFPKNPERRKKWMELGKVPPNLPESMYFFCSDHFDKKYQSVNNVRTVLVGEAVPFAYVEPEFGESTEDADGNLDYLYEINGNNCIGDKQEFIDDQDLQVESTTITSDIQDFHHDQLSTSLGEDEPDGCIIFTEDEKDNLESSITYSNKRKFNIIQTEIGSSKTKIPKAAAVQKPLNRSFEKTKEKISHQESAIKSLSSLSPNNRTLLLNKEANEDVINEDQLVDAQVVSTFIFKDEVYVQMPKKHYIEEKTKMIKKLRKMELSLKAIKQYLNAVDV